MLDNEITHIFGRSYKLATKQTKQYFRSLLFDIDPKNWTISIIVIIFSKTMKKKHKKYTLTLTNRTLLTYFDISHVDPVSLRLILANLISSTISLNSPWLGWRTIFC